MIPLRLLFVKHTLAWPRANGHDIRAYSMLKALHGLGHKVGLATVAPPGAEALHGLQLDCLTLLDPAVLDDVGVHLDGLQERFRSYWGVDPRSIAAVGRVAGDFRASAVVGLGLDALPYLARVRGAARIWYAGDEWVRHHLSHVRWAAPSSWTQQSKAAAIRGLYERAFAKTIDRVWVVSPPEQTAMRWFGGFEHVDVLPNGVDHVYFAPMAEPSVPHSAVFWGRLDFAPNIEALRWLCRDVWPLVRRRVPTAALHVMGFSPGPEVTALAAAPGIHLSPDVRDLRPEVAKHPVVVLPFHSGGGIKNKFLEAAAMGKPIVCTPRACEGLRGQPPAIVRSRPEEWVSALIEVWNSEALQRDLGARARQWAIREHSWQTTAAAAISAIRTGFDEPPRSPQEAAIDQRQQSIKRL
jgi:glycosyltransferase involved in cell wall biosynthesis